VGAAGQLSSFGIDIDNVHVQVVANDSILKDTTVVFPASATELRFSIGVALDQSALDAEVIVQLRQQNTVFFGGQQMVTLHAGQTTDPVSVEMTYVGPGSTVTLLVVTPQGQTVFAPSTLALHVDARDSHEVIVPDVPIDWSVDDATVASIAGNGVDATLTPTGKRGKVIVTARTPTGVSSTATAFVVPPASKLTVLGGDGQSAVLGSVLPTPFQVRVDGADGLPIKGITISFRPTTIGSVAPTSAVSDTNGLASTVMSLGSSVGAFTFEASTPGATTVTVTETATAGPPASIAISAGDGQSATVGVTLPVQPAVVAKDANGNPSPGVAVTFTAAEGSGGVSTGTTFSPSVSVNTDATGTAKVNWQLGAIAGRNVLTASVGTLQPVTFTATGTAGPPSQMVAVGANDIQINPGQQPPALSVRVTDGANGVDGVQVTFVGAFGACVLPGDASQVVVTTANGGLASVQPVLSPNATAPSSCGAVALAVNGQSVPLTGSPVPFKIYMFDPATGFRVFTGTNSTAWNDAKNWLTGVVPAQNDAVWLPSAAALSHTALLDAPRTIGSLITEGAMLLDLNKSTLTIGQNLNASAGGVVQNGTIQLVGKGAVASGTVQAAVIEGTPGCASGSSLSMGAGGFVVSGAFTANCSVDATNNPLTVVGASSFVGQGALFMGANSVVQFLGDVNFGGASGSIAGGLLQVSGNFQQTGTATFAPVPVTQMVFSGSTPQTITFANSASTLPNVVIQNTSGVTFNATPALVNLTNELVIGPNSQLTVAPGAILSIGLPPAAAGIPALELFPGSSLTINANGALRFAIPPGCVRHEPPAVTITIAPGGTFSDPTQLCVRVTP
jgi:hypothetical protein